MAVQARVAVVGAGVAGLACARGLVRAGAAVTAFDKGRGPGGRLATRRIDSPSGPLAFDHGAQFFTARGARFAAEIARLTALGAVQPWTAPVLRTRGRQAASPARDDVVHVGAPGMSALVKALADGLDVRFGATVTGLHREKGRWRLAGEGLEDAGPFDAVVVAVPAEQAAPLLSPVASALAIEAARAETGPCWAVMAAFDAPVTAPYAGLQTEDPVLGWIALEATKPGRAPAPARLVLHARIGWSKAHLEDAPETVSAALITAARRFLPDLPDPVVAVAHRWRYAQVQKPAGSAYGWDADLRLGVCGDWRLGPRVELAWDSGDALAAAMASAVRPG